MAWHALSLYRDNWVENFEQSVTLKTDKFGWVTEHSGPIQAQHEIVVAVHIARK